MVEIDHKTLKEYAKVLLLDMGFNESEIFEEYNIPVKTDHKFIVDIVGIQTKPIDRSVAIECGHTDISKIAALSHFFDQVIILPKNTELAIPEISKKIFIKEEENRKLKKEIEDLNEKIKNLQNKIELRTANESNLSNKIIKESDNLRTFATYLYMACKDDLEGYSSFYESLGYVRPNNYYDLNNKFIQLKYACFRNFVKKIDIITTRTDELSQELYKISYTEQNVFTEKILAMMQQTYNLKSPSIKPAETE